jgi:hypothetical protein
MLRMRSTRSGPTAKKYKTKQRKTKHPFSFLNPIMSDTFELNCCILRDDSRARDIFVVKISTTVSVGSLRKVIKDEQKDAFQYVDADSLSLSRVSVPINKGLEEELSKLDFDGGLLLTMQNLSEVFSEQPVQTYLHIVVKHAPNGEFLVASHHHNSDQLTADYVSAPFFCNFFVTSSDQIVRCNFSCETC